MAGQNNLIQNSTHNPTGQAEGDLSESFLTEKADTGTPKHGDSLLSSDLTSETRGSSHTPIEDEIDVGGWLCL